VVAGLVVHWLGLDPMLTAFNDQMALLPLAMSRILGFTTYLDIPQDMALNVALFGGALAVLGLLAILAGGRRLNR
jgi:polyferredoxin